MITMTDRIEGVDYRSDTRAHWDDARRLQSDWIAEGFRDVSISVLTDEHAARWPGGQRCLVRGWRPVTVA